MTKPKGKTRAVMAIQEQLDCIMGALVGWEMAERIIRIRIAQAHERTGLTDLLIPALEELDTMSARVCAAKAQVSRALSMLVE
jgi:hypothetical protein